jgi:general L-amino acid transport system permease protein
MFVAFAPLLYPDIPKRKWLLYFSVFYPFFAFVLIMGGYFGLQKIEYSLFGGFMLTVILGVCGIVCSLPLGILLALGRQSNLTVVRTLSVCFIEFMRGVPLITLLFVASSMLNYFLPPGTNFSILVRVIIMFTFFSAAYIAEVIRGGIQAIPKGQYEAADALGMNYWQKTRFITLPQALKISIPGIVNTFIGLYKDTTLVVVIGLLDPLGIGRAALADTKWNGLSTETYLFVALFFFVSCFAMSRYSLWLENKLNTDKK